MATFSVTDRGTYRRCRRLWDYSSNARRNLTPIGSGAPELELGGIIHRALAIWILEYKPENPGNLANIFLKQTGERIEEIKVSYREAIGAPISDSELDSIYQVVELGTAMMQNYQDHYKQPLPAHMSFAAAEQEILVDVPGTEHECRTCIERDNKQEWGAEVVGYNSKDDLPRIAYRDCKECNGTGIVCHKLSATVDGMLQDGRNGKLFVLEHKTYSRRPNLDELNRVDQFVAYAWAIRSLGIGKVGGIAYDGMWKRSKPPKGSVINDLFLRNTLLKTDNELDAFETMLALEINEMANNPSIYPNIPWQGCTYDCRFIEPCNALRRGEDDERILKSSYTQRKVIRISGVREDTV